MKRIIIYISLSILLACNNKTKTSNGETPTPTNIDNVNGNQPDTVNSTTLNSTPSQDSSRLKDSLHHHH